MASELPHVRFKASRSRVLPTYGNPAAKHESMEVLWTVIVLGAIALLVESIQLLRRHGLHNASPHPDNVTVLPPNVKDDDSHWAA